MNKLEKTLCKVALGSFILGTIFLSKPLKEDINYNLNKIESKKIVHRELGYSGRAGLILWITSTGIFGGLGIKNQIKSIREEYKAYKILYNYLEKKK